MPQCVTLCVCGHSHAYFGWTGAGKARRSNSFAVSVYAKQITVEMSSGARELRAFVPNRSDETDQLESERKELQSFSPLLTAF